MGFGEAAVIESITGARLAGPLTVTRAVPVRVSAVALTVYGPPPVGPATNSPVALMVPELAGAFQVIAGVG